MEKEKFKKKTETEVQETGRSSIDNDTMEAKESKHLKDRELSNL